MTFIVAIDGAAGTGKGTIAKGISKEFNLTKYQVLILTWLEGILIGVILCKFIL